MSNQPTMKQNLKSITKTSVNLPVDAAAAIAEVGADLGKISTSVIRGTLPTSKGFINAFGMFIYGMANSEATLDEAKIGYENMSLELLVDAIQAGALEAGQNTTKSWNEEDGDNGDIVPTPAELAAIMEARAKAA